jgi:F0F1-type ATP synthase epsilon subunit
MKLGPSTPKLDIKIFSPYQTYYEGQAVSVSAKNKTGPFDVLSGHINFFSLLSAGEVVINTGLQHLNVKIDRGIIKVTNNHVTVFVNV